ncbi:MAG TPA: hypothetical protein VGS20_10905 [Candidatus Acidoferrales bacterium]|nr:hypothetical protein [Candidatus Acidoferrales bacterium]
MLTRAATFVLLGAGREPRSYHYATDTVEAMLRGVYRLEEKHFVGLFNLGSKQRITIGDLAREVIAVSGKEIETAWDTSKPTLIWGQVLSCELGRELLDGWQPAVSLRDGLAACYQHIAARLGGLGPVSPASRDRTASFDLRGSCVRSFCIPNGSAGPDASTGKGADVSLLFFRRRSSADTFCFSTYKTFEGVAPAALPAVAHRGGAKAWLPRPRPARPTQPRSSFAMK